MKVVADSHTIYWYLNNPAELSEIALAALGDAEDSDGISVSAITIPELWMASTRKRSERAIPRSGYEIVRTALTNDEFSFSIEPITPAVWRHFEVISQRLPDPMDAIIVATALALDVTLVSRDSKIRQSETVDVIW